jgi:hypothetical protein
MNMKKSPDSQWKIDRHVPIALIVALCLQLISALIWATKLDARVTQIEQQSISTRSFAERFARIEERLNSVSQDTHMVKQLLSRLSERLIEQ